MNDTYPAQNSDTKWNNNYRTRIKKYKEVLKKYTGLSFFALVNQPSRVNMYRADVYNITSDGGIKLEKILIERMRVRQKGRGFNDCKERYDSFDDFTERVGDNGFLRGKPTIINLYYAVTSGKVVCWENKNKKE